MNKIKELFKKEDKKPTYTLKEKLTCKQKEKLLEVWFENATFERKVITRLPDSIRKKFQRKNYWSTHLLGQGLAFVNLFESFVSAQEPEKLTIILKWKKKKK